MLFNKTRGKIDKLQFPTKCLRYGPQIKSDAKRIFFMNLGRNSLVLLRHILSHKEKNRVCSKHFEAIKKFGKIFNTKKQKSQYKYISPLKEAGFSLEEALSFNFEAKQKMWKNCTNGLARNKGGRPSIDNFLIENLNRHLEENSSVAANRFLKRENTNVFYRNSTKIEAFKKYRYNKIISLTSFKKYFHRKFKKPHRVFFFYFTESPAFSINEFVLFLV